MSEEYYDIAISFIEKDKHIVEKIKESLQREFSIFAFYDKQTELAGTDGIDKFTDIFKNRCKIAVIIYNEGWGSAGWTKVEEQAIKSRMLKPKNENSEIFVIKADGSKTLPSWVPDSVIWYDLNQYGLETAIEALRKMISEDDLKGDKIGLLEKISKMANDNQFDKEKDEMLHSEAGVELANKETKVLLSEIEKLLKRIKEENKTVYVEIREKKELDIMFTLMSHYGHIYFYKRFRNSLNESTLVIWKQPTILRGEVTRTAYNAEFYFDKDRKGKWKYQDKVYTSAEMAEKALEMILG